MASILRSESFNFTQAQNSALRLWPVERQSLHVLVLKEFIIWVWQNVTPSRANGAINRGPDSFFQDLTLLVTWPCAKFTVSPMTSSKFFINAHARCSRGQQLNWRHTGRCKGKLHIQGCACAPSWDLTIASVNVSHSCERDSSTH